MAKTIVNCPNCKRPVQAEIQQLFDTNTDPIAKQKLLSGAVNMVICPHCGFRGGMSTPILYHDADKELLLTFVPPELGLPQNEQERIIGGLINQVMAQLPQEKRKGYLLRPQQTLTLQGLVDRILEADGITKEMVQAQQQRLSLIQRLLMASSDDLRIEIIKQEDQLIDEELFVLLERLIEASSASGDQNSSQKLADLQKMILMHSTFGQDLSSQLKEVEEAVKELKAAGKELTREKLLEIVVNAPNDERLKALVSLVRPGIDYIFFQLLSEKIDRARGDGRARLVQLRDQLLKLTQEYDQAWDARVAETQKKLDSILSSEDVESALMEQSPVVDELFITVLQSTMEKAEQEKDQQKLEKLERIVSMIQKASAPPPEMEFIEKLLLAENEADQRRLLEENKSEVSADFMNTLTNLVYQYQNNDNKELADKLSKLYKVVLRYSMESSLKES
jgi:hypothetical protein